MEAYGVDNAGSSPRVRGEEEDEDEEARGPGIIPAGAGRRGAE